MKDATRAGDLKENVRPVSQEASPKQQHAASPHHLSNYAPKTVRESSYTHTHERPLSSLETKKKI